ncbi:PH domain-containing protein [Mammaliicoccus fleurettii]|uniref:PH domain-containing protein n=1 Tax=Mammaliicoccus fleurettii TaxID=150056 RepID=UPI001C4F5AF9|nr:PH domain-containing protein [Mammaliicoccus fleurettii]MBW0765327.1 PH domain-containing protein [Mammaliicoccus fleurettii]
MYKQVLDNKMPKQSIKYEYIHHIFNVIAILILFSVFLYLWNKFEWWTYLIYVIPTLAIMMIVIGFINPIIRLKRTSFEIGEQYIEVQKGLYYQKRSVQPYRRVQFVKIKHGPISRMLNIYFVVVVTAGSSVFLPMVNRQTADKTRLNIMTKVKEVTDDV